jgi:hypothetical protein
MTCVDRRAAMVRCGQALWIVRPGQQILASHFSTNVLNCAAEAIGKTSPYFPRTLAHLALWAAAIRARPSGDILLFFLRFLRTGATPEPLGAAFALLPAVVPSSDSNSAWSDWICSAI